MSAASAVTTIAGVVQVVGDQRTVKVKGEDTTVGTLKVPYDVWNNQKKENDTVWLSINLFGRDADYAYGNLDNQTVAIQKGDVVVATGILSVREWSKDGRSGVSVELKPFSQTFRVLSRKEAAPAQSSSDDDEDIAF